jgi:hypothetical protein
MDAGWVACPGNRRDNTGGRGRHVSGSSLPPMQEGCVRAAFPDTQGLLIRSGVWSMTDALRTPESLAREWGCSERRLRRVARKIGACRIIGRRMILLESDVAAILEALKPYPSSSIIGTRKASGGCAAQLPANASMKVARLLAEKPPSESKVSQPGCSTLASIPRRLLIGAAGETPRSS